MTTEHRPTSEDLPYSSAGANQGTPDDSMPFATLEPLEQSRAAERIAAAALVVIALCAVVHIVVLLLGVA